MAMFKNKTKKTCSYFILLVSLILLIMGAVMIYLGYKEIGSENIEKMQSDYASFQIGYILGLLSLVGGCVILFTGILGIFTAACRNTGINCLFAIPFCVMAMLCMIFLLILAFIASGADGMIMQAKDEACAAPASAD